VRFDALDEFISGINIDAGVTIANGRTVCLHGGPAVLFCGCGILHA
jgi:hypothetical protein